MSLHANKACKQATQFESMETFQSILVATTSGYFCRSLWWPKPGAFQRVFDHLHDFAMAKPVTLSQTTVISSPNQVFFLSLNLTRA